MSDAAAPVAASPAKKVAKKPRAPKKPSTHPKTQVMVVNAIKALKERNGSSLQAIKKHIEANNKGIDMVKLNFHIKKCLKSGVEKKIFVQTKGSGASGSFKLAAKAEKPAAAKKPAAKKTPKKAAKKPAGEKKAKKSPAKKAKKPAAKKTPKKATKPKAPKKPAAKKAKSPAKKAAKKPAAKKPAKKAAPKKA